MPATATRLMAASVPPESRLARGRGIAAVVTVLLLCMLLHCKNADAASYTVGDAAGWTFNVQNWPKGKSFKAGDVLVFNYIPLFHNLVVVDKEGYDACRAAGDAKKFQTGKDSITLVKGGNYFICTFPFHCRLGMKIAVNAS
ncbi:Basic blue protein [Morella rubra]|uniref:Basic blue protein n=1 Tax=Morella rubra TaxID=262757 RepID=A0A6A1V2U8_9ROSI|nr:Basic blue protein [Morella rubra]KAB1207029.1 Basic blue protein [Morella rubra]